MVRRIRRALTLILMLALLVSALGAPAFAEDIIIEKVYASSDKEAVVMRTPNEIIFTTKTTGATISAVVWMDANGATLPGGDAFTQQVYTLTVTLTANPGYVFSQTALGYLYGKSANVSVSMDGKSISLRRNIEPPVWSPVVNKQPLTDPAIDPGGLVSYVATANFATSSQWLLVSPDGSQTLTVKEAVARFSGITVDDAGIGRIIIYNVPAEMNGWQIFCRFFESTGVYSSDTQKAVIQVNVPAPTPTPTPEATPEPTPEPSPEAAPEATEAPDTTPEPPEESAAPDEDEKAPAEDEPLVWKHNESGHWHERADGSTIDVGEHRFVWTQGESDGEEIGVCSECGYTVYRVSENASKQDVKGKILIGLGVVTGLLMMLSLAAPKKKKRRR